MTLLAGDAKKPFRPSSLFAEFILDRFSLPICGYGIGHILVCF